MFVFSSYKTIEIGVKSFKCRLMINLCSKPLLFRDISTSKNCNDSLTSFSLANFILACFVFKY